MAHLTRRADTVQKWSVVGQQPAYRSIPYDALKREDVAGVTADWVRTSSLRVKMRQQIAPRILFGGALQ